MAEFKKKKQYNFWYAPLTLISLLGLLIFSTFRVVNLIKKEMETTRQKNLASNNIQTLRNRENILTQDITKMHSKEGIENIIREKYQVVKKGEKMVIIVNNNDKKVSQKTKNLVKHSFWNWIINFLNNI